ncbi:hypothetical protein FGO68_gene11185 [Halteria grandinella]|uniref:Uncharacterized protein n=1 Tax=Halteria grandinella TaxID=5974 RepID=A0A8J8T7Q6_HALGN|nr:hypothetical protein FGO68_gene11185 [Halteria grandinella]
MRRPQPSHNTLETSAQLCFRWSSDDTASSYIQTANEYSPIHQFNQNVLLIYINLHYQSHSLGIVQA